MEALPSNSSHAKWVLSPAESTLGEQHGFGVHLERIAAGRVLPANSTRPGSNLCATTHGHRSGEATKEED